MNTSHELPLGIIDWGIGGFGLVRELLKAGVDRSIVYVSDSGSSPYGLQTEADLRARMERWRLWFGDQGCADVLVACNAASTVCTASMVSRRRGGTTLHGLIDATARAVVASGAMRVGVIGGARTIESSCYPAAAAACGSRARWTCVVAQPLSAFVERGCLEGPEVAEVIASITRQLGTIELLVSGCTHYAALRGPLSQQLPPGLIWLEPVEVLARHLIATGVVSAQRRETDHTRPRASPAPQTMRVYTTGAPEVMPGLVEAAFGVLLASTPVGLDVTTLALRDAST